MDENYGRTPAARAFIPRLVTPLTDSQRRAVSRRNYEKDFLIMGILIPNYSVFVQYADDINFLSH